MFDSILTRLAAIATIIAMLYGAFFGYNQWINSKKGEVSMPQQVIPTQQVIVQQNNGGQNSQNDQVNNGSANTINNEPSTAMVKSNPNNSGNGVASVNFSDQKKQVEDCALYKVGTLILKNGTSGSLRGSIYFKQYPGGLGQGSSARNARDFTLIAGDSIKILNVCEGNIEWAIRRSMPNSNNPGQIMWESMPSITNSNVVESCKDNLYVIK